MTVKVQDIIIGEGRPKICVPVMGKTKQDILTAAKMLKKKRGVSLAEWRADDFAGVFDRCAVADILKELRTVLGSMPLLATFRTEAEGGRCSAETSDYFKFLDSVIDCGMADMIDIELMSGDAAAVGAAAKAAGLVTIFSNHDFKATPDEDELFGRLRKMEALGADIAKLAVMPTCQEDVLRLLLVTLKASSKLACPVVTMSMGQSGLISRLCGQQFGSAITFGTAGGASAPGQIDAERLYDLLKLFEEKEV